MASASSDGASARGCVAPAKWSRAPHAPYSASDAQTYTQECLVGLDRTRGSGKTLVRTRRDRHVNMERSASMSEANIELLRRAWAAFDSFDIESFTACLAEDWREYDVEGNVVSTVDEERQSMELQRTAFPDRHTEIHRIVADSQHVACYCTITATHTGTYVDAKPTGKRLVTHVMMFNRVEGGRLAESWVLSEGAALYEQITGRPSPGSDGVEAAE